MLLFDGVFLLRPELIDGWDLRIFVSVAFEETLDRARTRAEALGPSSGTGGPESVPAAEVERRWHQRYKPGQQLYFDVARPTEHADIIVYNDALEWPTWEVRAT